MSATSTPVAGRRAWFGLAVLALPTILLALDLTVLHLAVPTLSAELRPSSSQLLWIVDVYGFAVAGLLITMGAIGDRIGRRRLLMIGAAAFAATSLLAAFATSPALLIAARALLGVAGATLMPSTLSLIRTMFPDDTQRNFAIAIWMTSFMVGGALGPLVGGVLLEWFWWGSVFIMAVPVMALLLVVGPLVLPESRDPEPGRIDRLSVAQSLGAMLLTVYGLKELAGHGIGMLPVVALIAGVLLGTAFIRRQRRLEHPLLDLSLFTVRAFNVALGTQTLALFAMAGVQLLIMQHLQLVLGLSPLHAGLWTLPSMLLGIAASLVSPAIAARVRPAKVISGGLLVAAAGLIVLTQLQPTSGIGVVVTAFAVLGAGFGPVLALGAGLVIGSAPEERAGAASGIQETGSELGLALGLAGLGSVGTVVYRSGLVDRLPDAVQGGLADAALETLGGAMAVAGQLPDALGDAVVEAAGAAFTSAIRVTSGISAVVLVGLAAAVAVGLRHVRPSAADAPEPTGDADPQLVA